MEFQIDEKPKDLGAYFQDALAKFNQYRDAGLTGKLEGLLSELTHNAAAWLGEDHPIYGLCLYRLATIERHFSPGSSTPGMLFKAFRVLSASLGSQHSVTLACQAA